MSTQTNSIRFRPHEQVNGSEFHKHVTRSKHLFRRADAYAVDAAQLTYFQQRGISHLYFHEQDTGRVYRITTDKFAAHGFALNQGHGEQIACRLQHFDETATEQQPPAAVTTSAKKNDYQQSPLFSLFAYGQG